MSWWKRWPGRLEAELEQFKVRRIEARQDMTEMTCGRVVIDARFAMTNAEKIPLRVVYPDTFPDLRFAVYAPSLKLRRHQAPFGGNLCLIGQASDNWRPSTMAADLIADRLPELIALVSAGGAALLAAEDPQGEPVTAFYGYTMQGGIIIPEAALHLPETATRGMFTIAFDGDPGWLRTEYGGAAIGTGLLVSVNDEKGQSLAEAEPVLRERFRGPVWRGAWVRCPTYPPGEDASRFGDIVTRRVETSLRRTNNRHGKAQALISAATFAEEVRQGEAGSAWVFRAEFVESTGRRGSRSLATLVRGLRFSPSELAMRIPELKPLSGKTVSIVGVGALGAPIATELARAQTKVVRLLDHDFVDPAGGVRWTQSLEGAGAAKVFALRQTIERNLPYTSVEATQMRVGDASPVQRATPENKVLDSFLEGAAMVIEATAYENVSRAIADKAQLANVPQIFVWGIDGYGGVVARCLPGRTGCYHCLSLAFANGTIPFPPAASDPDRLRVQPRGCADPTSTFSNAELMPLAGQATRLAFSMLSEDSPGSYPRFSKDVFVLSLRNPDGSFLDAPQWTAHSLEVNEQCPSCRPSFVAVAVPASESIPDSPA